MKSERKNVIFTPEYIQSVADKISANAGFCSSDPMKAETKRKMLVGAKTVMSSFRSIFKEYFRG